MVRYHSTFHLVRSHAHQLQANILKMLTVLVTHPEFKISADPGKVRLETSSGTFVHVAQELFQAMLRLLSWEGVPENLTFDLQTVPYQKLLVAYTRGKFLEVKLSTPSSCFQGMVRLFNQECESFIKEASGLLIRLSAMTSNKKKKDASTQTSKTSEIATPTLENRSTPSKAEHALLSWGSLRAQVQPSPICINRCSDVTPPNAISTPNKRSADVLKTPLTTMTREFPFRKRARFSFPRRNFDNSEVQEIPHSVNFEVGEEEEVAPEIHELITNVENQFNKEVVGEDVPDSLPNDYFTVRDEDRDKLSSLYKKF